MAPFLLLNLAESQRTVLQGIVDIELVLRLELGIVPRSVIAKKVLPAPEK